MEKETRPLENIQGWFYENFDEKGKLITSKPLKYIEGYICLYFDEKGNVLNEYKTQNPPMPVYLYPIDALPYVPKESVWVRRVVNKMDKNGKISKMVECEKRRVASIAICRCMAVVDPESYTEKEEISFSGETYYGEVTERTETTPVYHCSEDGERPYIPGYPYYMETLSIKDIIESTGTIEKKSIARRLLDMRLLPKDKIEERDLRTVAEVTDEKTGTKTLKKSITI